jgi:hypothetical protein
MPPKYKPGQKVPVSGQYPLVGPKGGATGQEVTAVKGEPFPPTPKPGMGYGTGEGRAATRPSSF